MLTVPAPFLFAFGVSAAVAFIAWRLRSLSLSGAIAAGVIGCAALSASWGMGCYLIAWFALATALSRIGKRRKELRVSGIVEKSSQRDAWQVLANGGVFFVCALLVALFTRSGFEGRGPAILFSIAGAGSLAAAGADTWATEIGTLVGGAPWSLRSFSRVPAGTSGAITLAGTLAMIAASVTLAALAFLFELIPRSDLPLSLSVSTAGAIAFGGIVGAFADTLFGAWLQERRWCPRCTTETEQFIHRCGTPTAHHAGLGGLNNDWVNVFCSLIGALAPFVPLLILSLYA
ncbi:MAG: DUF92 domain-containing protein [Gemmatimonadaceae bacterium]